MAVKAPVDIAAGSSPVTPATYTNDAARPSGSRGHGPPEGFWFFPGRIPGRIFRVHAWFVTCRKPGRGALQDFPAGR